MSIVERIGQARAVCLKALETAPLAEVGAKITRIGAAGSPVDWICHLWRHGEFPPPIKKILALVGDNPGQFVAERIILLQAALQSLDLLAAARLDLPTQALICRQYEFFANPGEEWLYRFDPAKYPYRAYAGLGILQRFPAGRMDWEVSGIPYSWLPKVRKKDLLKVLATVMFKLGGRGPVAYTHLAYNQARIQIFVEQDVRLSYLRVARSLVLRPELRAIVTDSWLYSPETHRVNPHLAWTTRLFEENDGCITEIGLAPPDSGFLVGNTLRQKLFESGDYKPTETVIIWPRQAALAWLSKQPDVQSFDSWASQ